MIIDSSAPMAILQSEPDAALYEQLDALLEHIQPEIVSLDRSVADLARSAFRQFGRGRHKAKLNFGDCISYAAAQYLRLPLLYRGEDFPQTGIPSASAKR